MEKIATRDALGEEVLELGMQHKDVYVVDCDVAKSCKTLEFAEKLPQQHVNVGIAEQNAVDIAAGLATTGKVPFVVTYAIFGSMRACEQIRQECCYTKLNVKILCSHGGLTPANDGASHQCIEDMGVLRTIPGMTVIMPADYYAAKKLSEDGSSIDEKYLNRMKRIIDAADRIGMAVIVCMFYGAQSRFLKDDDAVFRAVKSVSNWARDNSFTNVILEIANEHDVDMYHIHPVLYLDTGIAQLLEVASRESGGIPVGCSGTGKVFSRNIADKSDVVLIHGNDKTRQRLYDFIQKAKAGSSGKPVVINEDSQCIGNMMTAMDVGVSWGYYNNMTKQEPPCDYGITKGEDQFFAMRLSQQLGTADSEPPVEEQFYLQGLEKDMEYDGKRWIRLASLHPERIDKVILYRNNRKAAVLYDEPFFLNAYGNSNWLQMPFEEKIIPGEKWKAEVILADGRIITKETTAI